MKYNQLSYYRANPYYYNDFLPPIANLNRKKKDFTVQLPQGQQFLPVRNRRHFKQKSRSNIEQDNIFQSPERYPYENRIAMDKGYFRSLNTIDIQGACSNSFISEAVKNKMRAQQQLKRQNKVISQQQLRLRYLEKSQQQRKRQVANQQFHKNREIVDILSTIDQKNNHYAQIIKHRQKKQELKTNRLSSSQNSSQSSPSQLKKIQSQVHQQDNSFKKMYDPIQSNTITKSKQKQSIDNIKTNKPSNLTLDINQNPEKYNPVRQLQQINNKKQIKQNSLEHSQYKNQQKQDHSQFNLNQEEILGGGKKRRLIRKNSPTYLSSMQEATYNL